MVNGGRAFITIGAAALFWVVTAWPAGALAIAFAAIVLLLTSPKGDQAPAGAMQFLVGPTLGMLLAGIANFAVLPALSTFPGFCLALGLFLIPMGIGLSNSRPAFVLVFTGMPVFFMALLAPANQMTYDTGQYYNSALAVFAGSAAAAVSFRLLPPLSPALLVWSRFRRHPAAVGGTRGRPRDHSTQPRCFPSRCDGETRRSTCRRGGRRQYHGAGTACRARPPARLSSCDGSG